MNSHWAVTATSAPETRWEIGGQAWETPAAEEPLRLADEDQTGRLISWIEYSAAGLALTGMLLSLVFLR